MKSRGALVGNHHVDAQARAVQLSLHRGKVGLVELFGQLKLVKLDADITGVWLGAHDKRLAHHHASRAGAADLGDG
jgi:hypothetical protein